MTTTKKSYYKALGGFLLLVFWLWLSVLTPLNTIQDTWLGEQGRYIEKSTKLIELADNMGYGGVIHNFKNYVIRRERQYLEATFEKMDSSRKILQELSLVSFSDDEKKLLDQIRETLEQYDSKAQWMAANQNIVMKQSVHQLDAIIKVDDSQAFHAIETLIEHNREEFQLSVERTNRIKRSFTYQTIAWGVVLSIAYWVIAMAVLYLNKSRNMSSAQLRSINQLSPLAMVVADDKGKILEVNPAFRSLFNVPENVNVSKFAIEKFVPDSVKERHVTHREKFQLSDRFEAMAGRDQVYYAKKYSGEEFPADIAISSMDIEGMKTALAIIKDKSEENVLKAQAELDHLTNIYNRRFAEQYLDKALYQKERYGEPLSVLLVDIDHFKRVNDELGHQYGDKLLLKTISLMESYLRKSDILARWGGDEFLCILPNTTAKGAEHIANKLVDAVRREFKDEEVPTTLSIGVTESTRAEDFGDLIRSADLALYSAKRKGRDGVHCN